MTRGVSYLHPTRTFETKTYPWIFTIIIDRIMWLLLGLPCVPMVSLLFSTGITSLRVSLIVLGFVNVLDWTLYVSLVSVVVIVITITIIVIVIITVILVLVLIFRVLILVLSF